MSSQNLGQQRHAAASHAGSMPCERRRLSGPWLACAGLPSLGSAPWPALSRGLACPAFSPGSGCRRSSRGCLSWVILVVVVGCGLWRARARTAGALNPPKALKEQAASRRQRRSIAGSPSLAHGSSSVALGYYRAACRTRGESTRLPPIDATRAGCRRNCAKGLSLPPSLPRLAPAVRRRLRRSHHHHPSLSESAARILLSAPRSAFCPRWKVASCGCCR
jgi:hypothetical protein